MNQRPLYEYIFNMIDYADELSVLIRPGEFDNGNYFMSLVYIEDMLDKYGRALVHSSAGETEGVDRVAQMREATRRMDLLRMRIRQFSQEYDFDELLKSRGAAIYHDWRKRQDSTLLDNR